MSKRGLIIAVIAIALLAAAFMYIFMHYYARACVDCGVEPPADAQSETVAADDAPREGTSTEYAEPAKDDPARGTDPAGADERQRSLLEEWLRENGGWRVAEKSDYDADLLELGLSEKGADYMPQYASGDFNGDAEKDFAALLVDKKNEKRLGLVVFNGPFGSAGKQEAAFFSDELQSGDALHVKEKELWIGPFASDNILILRPKGKSYELEALEMPD